VKSEKRVKMGKKTRKAIEELSESVAKTQKRNAKLLEDWAGRVVEALEAQTESNREMTRTLQSYLDASGEERQHGEGARSASAQNEDHAGTEQESETEREVTEAAERKAEELGVDLDKVEGTGRSGRVVVDDVEDAAERAEGENTPA
jgi:pyruvate/2-oxoglutarate dehydrogenase complex dihydrolipoamide acyltransferase (E2) component